jgi:hypothetical protein
MQEVGDWRMELEEIGGGEVRSIHLFIYLFNQTCNMNTIADSYNWRLILREIAINGNYFLTLKMYILRRA